ncbi:MAG: DUF1294 domain-containing protein [Silicimonas sp.]|nr:DUF1294 domain-containing protein [Silicimonas sp.]
MNLHLTLGWFFCVSLFSFALMYVDKRAARAGRSRVPERTLLLSAFLGGGPGAKLAQARFRHKTQKQPFKSVLNLAVIANGFLAAVILSERFRAGVLGMASGLI